MNPVAFLVGPYAALMQGSSLPGVCTKTLLLFETCILVPEARNIQLAR